VRVIVRVAGVLRSRCFTLCAKDFESPSANHSDKLADFSHLRFFLNVFFVLSYMGRGAAPLARWVVYYLRAAPLGWQTGRR
jgi:hypothetical protein